MMHISWFKISFKVFPRKLKNHCGLEYESFFNENFKNISLAAGANAPAPSCFVFALFLRALMHYYCVFAPFLRHLAEIKKACSSEERYYFDGAM